MRHIPVLLNEVIAGLNLKTGDTVVDCTLGDAGHSEAILQAIGPTGTLIGIDADPEAILRAKKFLQQYESQVVLACDNFINLKKIISDTGFTTVDAILMDLGWSSPQFEERERGFSFLKDEPLDMRYSGSLKSVKSNVHKVTNEESDFKKTAAEILNTYRESELATIFHQFGEDKFYKEIAAEIVKTRTKKPLERTTDLNAIILNVYRTKLKTTKAVPWIAGHHPATQTYQALRIAVNRELEALRQALPQAVAILSAGGLGSPKRSGGGRLGVITFHSVEDRLVKQCFKSQKGKTIRLVNKKPIIAGEVELKNNPRSRSAKLRIVERL